MEGDDVVVRGEWEEMPVEGLPVFWGDLEAEQAREGRKQDRS